MCLVVWTLQDLAWHYLVRRVCLLQSVSCGSCCLLICHNLTIIVKTRPTLQKKETMSTFLTLGTSRVMLVCGESSQDNDFLPMVESKWWARYWQTEVSITWRPELLKQRLTWVGHQWSRCFTVLLWFAWQSKVITVAEAWLWKSWGDWSAVKKHQTVPEVKKLTQMCSDGNWAQACGTQKQRAALLQICSMRHHNDSYHPNLISLTQDRKGDFWLTIWCHQHHSHGRKQYLLKIGQNVPPAIFVSWMISKSSR